MVGGQEVVVDPDQVQPRGHTTLAPATTCLQTQATGQTTIWTEAWTGAWIGPEVHMPGPEVPHEDFPPQGGREVEEGQDTTPWIVTETDMAVIETLCP